MYMVRHERHPENTQTLAAVGPFRQFILEVAGVAAVDTETLDSRLVAATVHALPEASDALQ